jgi:hypothetical protein
MSIVYDGATTGLLLYSRSYGNVFNGANGGTVMAWIRPVNGSPAGTNGVGGASIGSGGGSSNLSRANLELVGGGIRFTVRSADADGGTGVTSSSLAALSGTWIHVAGTVNWITKQASVYVNGLLSNTVLAAAMTAGAPTTASTSGGIGCGLNGTGSFFNGLIEDFRMYSVLFGPNEIFSIFSARGKDTINNSLIMRFQQNELAPSQTAQAVSINSMTAFGPAANTGTPVYGSDTYSTPRRKPRHPTGTGDPSGGILF